MKNLTVDENKILRIYRQLKSEGKTELFKRMKTMLDEQEEGNNHEQKQHCTAKIRS